MLAYLFSFDVFLWLAIAAIQSALSIMLLRRDAGKRYPAFCLFIYFSALTTWYLMAIPSGRPWTYFWSYYAISVVQCVLMAVAIGELYRKTFGKRWARVPAWVPRNIGAWLAAAISSCALLAIELRPLGPEKYVVVMGGLEAALVSALLISLVILIIYSRHLGIGWRPWPQRIAIGLLISLSVNGATMFMIGITSRETAALVRRTGMLAYFVSLLWWGCTLWARETVPEKATSEQVAEMVGAHRQTLAAAAQFTE
ncbi:MAG TPA: hypothetical protein VGQ12_07355 [Candidatus Angelobacter sp.]|jgi:hypothetical protein|nr:hypothetical protein [Candidatus Angelobacter sp.]